MQATTQPVSIPRLSKFKPDADQRELVAGIVTTCQKLSEARKSIDGRRLKALAAEMASEAINDLAEDPTAESAVDELLSISPVLVAASSTSGRDIHVRAVRHMLNARIREVAESGRPVMVASMEHDLEVATARFEAVRAAEDAIRSEADLGPDGESPTVQRLRHVAQIIARDLQAMRNGEVSVEWTELRRLLS